MAVFNEILNVLEKKEYKIDSNTIVRVHQLLECLKDENNFHTLPEVLEWFRKRRNECGMEASKIGINQLEKWNIDQKTGNIVHESGEFFTVIGVKVVSTLHREVVGGWTQPMFDQKEGGILGVLCQNFNGVRHYLIHAKAEPGNIGKLLLSPTLQATFSNLKQAHDGKKPKFAEYFEYVEETGGKKNNKIKVLYSQWQTEDGGRFYLKTNKNMLAELDEHEKIAVPPDYLWLTMYQLKQLLQHDNIVGHHLRSVIAHL